jgi:hypothetical protein
VILECNEIQVFWANAISEVRQVIFEAAIALVRGWHYNHLYGIQDLP